MIEEQEQTGFTHWMRESIVVKLSFIAILVLVLLIPSFWVQNLITERAARQDAVTREVAGSWSDTQLVKGPVLVIPYKAFTKSKDTKGREVVTEDNLMLHVLPDQLHIKANVNTSVLHRGIFSVIVYSGQLRLSGVLPAPDLKKLGIDPLTVDFSKAHLVFGLTDMRGLKNNPVVRVGNVDIAAEPTTGSDTIIDDGLQVPVNADAVKAGSLTFSIVLDIKGSQSLHFMHIAKTTDVEVTGNWPHPSFEGRYLPDNRSINNKGFTANWKMAFNRAIPQQWTADETLLSTDKAAAQSTFGVKLVIPVDQYQQTMRTSKYSALIILLTFISLFLTELIRKQRIHVFNYILIGCAMIVFYTLLLSFSEQIGYNLAYLVASVATIGLISFFIASLLNNRGAAGMFAAILALFYGFIFIIIQLEDLALLVGSIALFIITAVLMYFSRKINWDRH